MSTHPGPGPLFVGCYGPGTGEPTLVALDTTRAGDGVVRRIAALGLPDPSWGAFTPDGTVLHLVSERVPGQVVSVDPRALLSGERDPVVARSGTDGAQPAHAVVSPDGRRLAVTNYGDGMVSVVDLDAAGLPTATRATFRLDGRGPDPDRQTGPHAHHTRWLSERRMLVTDLGGDALQELGIGDDGRLRQLAVTATAPGTGPRHTVPVGPATAGAPDGGESFVLVEELTGTLSWWDRAGAEDGPLSRRATVACVTDGTPGVRQPAGAIAAGAGDGSQVLYATTRGADVITTFAVRPDAEVPLVPIGQTPAGGRAPRDLTVHDGLLWVAAGGSDVVSGLAIDPRTGVAGEVVVSVTAPGAAWLGVSP